MKKYRPADLSQIKTCSAQKRKTRVELDSFAKPTKKSDTFKKFYNSLPEFLAANSLKEVVKAIASTHKNKRPVIIGMGAHVIKVGLSPLIIELMKKGIVSCVAMNGAGAIHDFEVATLGRTSEDVAEGLETGMFGMVEETLRDFNLGIRESGDPGIRGMGKLLGQKLDKMNAPHKDLSILAAGAQLDVPVTVHVAIGTDTVHMSPHLDPEALGSESFADFRLLCSVVGDLEGGVYLNIGSAVLLPEVFLKALTVARNLGHKVKNFTTVNMDMIQHYRPQQNVLSRPGGKAYALTGHHEIMVPLLYQALMESL